jgi:WD40 repeat protein
MKRCHEGTINDLLIIPEKDLLLTSSSDNSIKIWRLSFLQTIGTISKAHEDAVKGLIYHPATETVISGGLDKFMIFWSLEKEGNERVFTQAIEVIEENEEDVVAEENDTPAQLMNNTSSIGEIVNFGNVEQESGPKVNYTLVKKDKMSVDRIIEMNQPGEQADLVYFLIADNKSIHKMRISDKEIVKSYIKENQDIMTFCVNGSGSLLITSMIGTVPCFHLWMISHSDFLGENPVKMFANKKFFWKSGKKKIKN